MTLSPRVRRLILCYAILKVAGLGALAVWGCTRSEQPSEPVVVITAPPPPPPGSYRAARLAFVTQPTSIIAGDTIPTIAVELQDSSGQRFPKQNVEVLMTIINGAQPDTLRGPRSAMTTLGVATFSGLWLTRARSYQLVAHVPGLENAVSNSFEVRHGPPVRLVFPDMPSWTYQGDTIHPPVRVAIADSSGNTVPEAAATITLDFVPNIAPPQHLQGTLTVSTIGGIASFTDIIADSVGPILFHATAPSLAAGQSNDYLWVRRHP